MINLGRYPGKNFPQVNIPLALPDMILEGVSVVICLIIGVFTLVNHEQLAAASTDFWVWGAVSLLITVLFLFASRASAKWMNFPFPVTEQNVWRQFFLIKRFLRGVSVIFNLLFLIRLLSIMGSEWNVASNVFGIMSIVVMSLMGISFFSYFIIAWRWR